MDGAYMLEDYARVVRILEEGIPSQDEAWHGMAVNKVKARLALQEGRKRDAVAFLRASTTFIAQVHRYAADPSTGIVHTREMRLGDTNRQMAELLDSLGDGDGARAARTEAARYYREALESMDPSSRAYQIVKEAMQALAAE
jgi:hypothetical protein